LGYLCSLAKEKGNFTVNAGIIAVWLNAAVNKLRENGVKTFLVVEYSASRLCANQGVKVERRPRDVLAVLSA
jgi:GMP synthase-like glutamine amidotransferase